jgi:hypothetical protein
VSPQTVRNWIRAGRLPAIQLSTRVIRIPRVAFERFHSGVLPPVPPELLEPRDWREGMAEYERYFGMRTQEMLALHAAGKTLELRTADDERMFEAWLGSAHLAIEAGLMEAPAPLTVAGARAQ